MRLWLVENVVAFPRWRLAGGLGCGFGGGVDLVERVDCVPAALLLVPAT